MARRFENRFTKQQGDDVTYRLIDPSVDLRAQKNTKQAAQVTKQRTPEPVKTTRPPVTNRGGGRTGEESPTAQSISPRTRGFISNYRDVSTEPGQLGKSAVAQGIGLVNPLAGLIAGAAVTADNVSRASTRQAGKDTLAATQRTSRAAEAQATARTGANAGGSGQARQGLGLNPNRPGPGPARDRDGRAGSNTGRGGINSGAPGFR